MIKNYLRVLFRNFFRQKSYVLINITGLALGIACTILIMMYVQYEIGYDQFHKKSDNIYRSTMHIKMGGNEQSLAITMPPLVPESSALIPEIIAGARYSEQENTNVKIGDRSFSIKNSALVDKSFINIFSFKLLHGTKEDFLSDVNSISITESTANKLFGKTDVLGETLIIENTPYEVSTILKDPPKNSHFNFEMLLSFEKQSEALSTQWGMIMLESFFLLDDKADPAVVQEKIQGVFDEKFGFAVSAGGSSWELRLQPLSDIHMRSNLIGDRENGGNLDYVYGFSIIAAFILILACINFINLSTARATKRAREVGVRKVLGARRSNLISQFMGESFVFSLISILISLLLVKIALPYFNIIAQREMYFAQLADPVLISGLLLILFLTAILSGSFPSFYISSFQPVAVLKGNTKRGKGGVRLRQVLVVAQFIISIALIFSTVTVYQQLHYMQNKHLGFDKEHIVTFMVNDYNDIEKLPLLKEEMLKVAGIENASLSNCIPFGNRRAKAILDSEIEDQEPLETWMIFSDHDFVNTWGLELANGRDFNKDLSTDASSAVIINEAAAKRLGYTNDAVGHNLEIPRGMTHDVENESSEIIGVVKDFHFHTLRAQIEPLIIYISSDDLMRMTLRIQSENMMSSLASAEKVWKEIYPDLAFEPVFINDRTDAVYRTEKRFATLISSFSVLAIAIAALGLFGLASYSTETRTKEIGIRMAMGATPSRIILLLNGEFIKPVTIALLIASPLTWFFMHKWLEEFAYRVQIGPFVVLATALTALFIALLSVSFQAIRASKINPADAFRYE